MYCPLDQFPQNLIIRIFMKTCLETPNFIEIGQKYWALDMKACKHFVVASHINPSPYHLCAKFSICILLTVTRSSTTHTDWIAAFPVCVQ
jgi:hypothetical protein